MDIYIFNYSSYINRWILFKTLVSGRYPNNLNHQIITVVEFTISRHSPFQPTSLTILLSKSGPPVLSISTQPPSVAILDSGLSSPEGCRRQHLKMIPGRCQARHPFFLRMEESCPLLLSSIFCSWLERTNLFLVINFFLFCVNGF